MTRKLSSLEKRKNIVGELVLKCSKNESGRRLNLHDLSRRKLRVFRLRLISEPQVFWPVELNYLGLRC